MAILKNKTQKNFTMISNNILCDRALSMKDRGVLCTLCSLPDGWDFSITGLSAIVPDGTSSIRASIESLEKLGYLIRTKTRDAEGHFTSTIEIFTEKRKISDITHERKPVTDNPSREIQGGYSATDNQPQYNTQNIKNKDNTKMIYQSSDLDDEIDYRKQIADNIKLDTLLSDQSYDKNQIEGVYELIVKTVNSSDETMRINSKEFPSDEIKTHFLKLGYDEVKYVLNQLNNPTGPITNPESYIKTLLYNTLYFKHKPSQSSRSNTYQSPGMIRNQFNNYPQRNDYNFEELERRLVKN